ncbi:hypothetical protein OUZ56_010189 [Daphnia magna]|uniref:Uncharacterized protein n=1 Tax=Daphnia magna TaxID=35525 RepID=A0ABR0AI10_9CRUS|nr:hypothetical protein OUZ56_010168 [Daphnia magna]KAK4024765.1 hypothetical protein OUZ56_010189 [Daphnia magna]
MLISVDNMNREKEKKLMQALTLIYLKLDNHTKNVCFYKEDIQEHRPLPISNTKKAQFHSASGGSKNLQI